MSVHKELLSDLTQFETHHKFNVDQLLACLVRGEITKSFNKIDMYKPRVIQQIPRSLDQLKKDHKVQLSNIEDGF